MEITTSHSADHIIVSCTNEYYTLRWHYDYADKKLAKYIIDSLFFEETGYFEIKYDTNRNPISFRAFIYRQDTQITPICEITMKYVGDDIVYYSDQDGNWYDRELMGDNFPYDDPLYLKKKAEKALEEIKKNGTTAMHYIVEPDMTRYE